MDRRTFLKSGGLVSLGLLVNPFRVNAGKETFDEARRRLWHFVLEFSARFKNTKDLLTPPLPGTIFIALTHSGIKKEGEPFAWAASSAGEAVDSYISALDWFARDCYEGTLVWRDLPQLDCVEREERTSCPWCKGGGCRMCGVFDRGFQRITEDPGYITRPECYVVWSRLRLE